MVSECIYTSMMNFESVIRLDHASLRFGLCRYGMLLHSQMATCFAKFTWTCQSQLYSNTRVIESTVHSGGSRGGGGLRGLKTRPVMNKLTYE